MKKEHIEIDTDVFRSNICHRVKDMGEFDFVISVLQSEIIFEYWNDKELRIHVSVIACIG